MRYIYGPVSSWRLGSSLGIDPLSQSDKVCNFDCIYCQLGKTPSFTTERRVYIQEEEILEELKMLPEIEIDYITFSGRGEPTLAQNLGELIKAVKSMRKEPIAVLTNSSLMDREDVRYELSLADFVVAKLDAVSQESLLVINRPAPSINLKGICDGLKRFRKEYKKRLSLQIMFISQNRDMAGRLKELAKQIQPDEVQINTPLRPSLIRPLSASEISNVKGHFKEMTSIAVYDKKPKEVRSISKEETLKRRGGS